MLSDVIEILKFLTSSVKELSQLGDKRRQKLASACEKIRDVLDEFIKAPRERRKAINLCARLREHVVPIKETATGAITSDEINRLATELDRVCDAWSKLTGGAELVEHSYEQYLDHLAEGKGLFEGLAERLRAS
jgi:uncharacterized FlaG/YvyC family protein